jgi:hypothetical protein
LNKSRVPSSYLKDVGVIRAVPSKTNNDRVELEMKIMKYRALARQTTNDPVTEQRINSLVFELEQKLREIDE